MRIIILGAEGHVGSNLCYYLSKQGSVLIPFSRTYITDNNTVYNTGDFLNNSKNIPDADILVNCIGLGTPEQLKQHGDTLRQLEHIVDDACMNYLSSHDARFVYFSSGIANEKYRNDSVYCRTKLEIEERHARSTFPITDIRLYSFFSRYADMNASFLLPSLIKGIKEKRCVEVAMDNCVRDYIHGYDLANIILNMGKYTETSERIIEAASCGPIDKSTIIKYLTDRYGLKVVYCPTLSTKVNSYIPPSFPPEATRILNSFQTIQTECYNLFPEW